jgi:hypothetical protein
VDHLGARLAGRERRDADARFGELLRAYEDLAASDAPIRMMTARE